MWTLWPHRDHTVYTLWSFHSVNCHTVNTLWNHRGLSTVSVHTENTLCTHCYHFTVWIATQWTHCKITGLSTCSICSHREHTVNTHEITVNRSVFAHTKNTPRSPSEHTVTISHIVPILRLWKLWIHVILTQLVHTENTLWSHCDHFTL